MRWIGATVVTLALVLGAGGVARRPLAEPSEPAAAPAGAESADASEAAGGVAPPTLEAAAGGSCRATPPRGVSIDLSHVTPPEGFVSLNARGYNYRRPGEPPQHIPAAPRTAAPQTPAAP
jgi:hypothetical protein